RERGVEIRPESACFGFAAFTHEGPLQDQIEPVFRQRQIMHYLIEALIDAGPRSLVAVRREQTVGRIEREARAAALALGETPPEVSLEDPDIFIIDPRMSARVPGFIDTRAFQLVFTGETAALRTFLNRLARFEVTILVREVQVDTTSGDEGAVGAGAMEFAASAGGRVHPDPASFVLSVPAQADAVPARPPDARAADATRSTRDVP